MDSFIYGNNEPIAILGIGCRFPGGINSPDTFWNFIREGKNAITEVPSDRWDIRRYYDSNRDKSGKVYTKKGGFLDRIDLFDPQFFGISPREASYMDPQQRLLLEVTWEALEDAGIDPQSVAGTKTGVYIGLFMHDFENMHSNPSEHKLIGPHSATGLSSTISANRISYIYDFRGPSAVVDTACSSSLVAVHLACRSLLENECTMAIAGGVNLLLKPEMTISLCKGGFLSPDGQCKSFDASANGYVRSEGSGVVVLKRLSKAIADGDHIYAVIRGTAVNQDGHSDGLTVPSKHAQIEMIRNALDNAGVSPEDIQYVEAHGTGTPVGDPIEAAALGEAFCRSSGRNGHLVIGSVKSNLGHTESAAGIAGLIKVILALKNKEIPPNLHFNNPNPAISFDTLQLRVPTCLQPWPVENDKPRRAGVNSFGFGGTNAHAILEEYKQNHKEVCQSEPDLFGKDTRPSLIPLSGHTNEALLANAQAMAEFLENNANSDNMLADIAYSTSLHKSHHPFRLTVAAATMTDLTDKLKAYILHEKRTGISSAHVNESVGYKNRTAFIFSGMGPQWWAMGHDLIKEEPVFREKIEECDTLFKKHTSEWSILDEFQASEATSRIQQTCIAQPCIFSLQIALAALWDSWGIIPEAVLGHSIGEVAASHVSGILSLADAICVCYHRSRLQQTKAGSGSMLAVGMNAEEAKRLITGYQDIVSIAAINSPTSVTLAGDTDILLELLSFLEEKLIFAKLLNVEVPYHSSAMDCILPELVDSISNITPRQNSIPLYSTVTGEVLDWESMNAGYWAKNVRNSVLFEAAYKSLLRDNFGTFIEISAHPVLAANMKECLLPETQALILPSLRRNEADGITMRDSFGCLFNSGSTVDFGKLFTGKEKFVRLPSYQWQRESYWLESEESKQSRLGYNIRNSESFEASSIHPLLGRKLRSATSIWQSVISENEPEYIKDHKVQNSIVFPAAGYIEMALCAASNKPDCIGICDIRIKIPLVINSGEQILLQLIEDEKGSFNICSKPEEGNTDWQSHVYGKYLHARKEFVHEAPSLDALMKSCTKKIEKADCYASLLKRELGYGPDFQCIENIWSGKGEALSKIKLGLTTQNDEAYLLHPALLDACLQTMVFVLESEGTYLPVGAKELRFYSKPETSLWCHVQLVEKNSQLVSGNILLFDDAGNIFVEIHQLQCRQSSSTNNTAHTLSNALYEYKWINIDTGFKLPSPSSFYNLVNDQVNDLTLLYDRNSWFGQVEPEFDNLCVSYIIRAFEDMGISMGIGQMLTAKELIQDYNILDKYTPLVNRMLEILSKNELLTNENGRWRVVDSVVTSKPNELWKRIAFTYPAYHNDLMLLRKCGTMLKEILLGQADPLSIIFTPDSPVSEYFYSSSPNMAMYNRLLQQAMHCIIEKLPKDKVLNILELGGGTGAASSYILPLLSPHLTSYTFTDISAAFCRDAEAKFKDYSFVEYKTLDIEKRPSEQGFTPHSYDIIIAFDVIHATEDLSNSLANVKELLVPSGILLLLEITHPTLWFDLVFGTLDGWWRFTDYELRPKHPLLDREKWVSIMEQMEFSDIQAIPEMECGYYPLQTLFVASAPDMKSESIIEKSDFTVDTSHRQWMIFNDKGGAGIQLGKVGCEHEYHILNIQKGSCWSYDGYGNYEIDFQNKEDFNRLFKETYKESEPPVVVFLWAMDLKDTVITAEKMQNSAVELCTSLLYIVQSMMSINWLTPPDLWIVTSGMQSLDNATAISITQSPILGMARVISTEYKDLRTYTADLNNPFTRIEIERLFKEIVKSGPEDELVIHEGGCFVHRLTTENFRKDFFSTELPYSLVNTNQKSYDRFTFVENSAPTPSSTQIQIRVMAAGVNFKDVLKAGDVLEDSMIEDYGLSSDYGLECSGIVTALGQDVTGFSIGDRVMGLSLDTFSNYIVADPGSLVKIPMTITFEAAAALPIACLTSYHALCNLAKMKKGDKVLIHTATGSVGLAAVHIAISIGAQVFATAGTHEKREYLRDLDLAYVGDSRTLDFAQEILCLTNHEGIDIVLNSLPEHTIEKSMSVLKPHTGRYIELSNLYRDELHVYNPYKGITVHTFDMESMMRGNPGMAGEMLHIIADEIHNGTKPLLPFTVFPAHRVSDTLKSMRKSTHIGKVVLSMQEPGIMRVPKNDSLPVSADATYLITGGFSGFGLSIAQKLVQCGARNLVLVGRTGASTPEAQEALNRMSQEGINVLAEKANITNMEQLAGIFSKIENSMPPLRGVVHSAMVLEDSSLMNMTSEQLQKVMAPKVAGAWNLHLLTEKVNLDYFICFSSFAFIVGNEGQGNYAAANSFLDSLSVYRKSLGLPALTVSWGAINGAGYVFNRPEIRELFHRQGIREVSLELAWKALSYALRENRTSIAVTPLDWDILKKYSISVLRSPRFSGLLHTKAEIPVNIEGKTESLSNLLPEELKEKLSEILTGVVSGVLGISAIKLEPHVPLGTLGFDSLMAVELVLRIENSTGVTMPKMSLLKPGLNIEALTNAVQKELSSGAININKAKTRAMEKTVESRPEIILPAHTEIKEPTLPGIKTSAKAFATSVQVQPDVKRLSIELPKPNKTHTFKYPQEYLTMKEAEIIPGISGSTSLYFTPSEGINNNLITINGQELINFSSYNYIGMSGDPLISMAAKEAIDRYGTSVSASRLVSGEKPLHRLLETALSKLLQTEDCVAFIGGYLANESVIGSICKPGDLILHDSLIHASIQMGCKLSGADSKPFPHNNIEALDHILVELAPKYQQILIIIEGVYSMDGDIPDLPSIIEIKKKHGTMLMVDEAHSIGVLGKNGGGIGEYYQVNRDDVDLWMGTLSKSFASCGGYFAGTKELIEFLRFTTPGFVYSVGMSPPNAAAALAAIELMEKEPQRLINLHERAGQFLKLAEEHGIPTGSSKNSAVIPVILKSSQLCLELYQILLKKGIYALPMMYPAVPENASRLRFFISSTHTREQIQTAVEAIVAGLKSIQPEN